MHKKTFILTLSFVLLIGLTGLGTAAKIAPPSNGDGFKTVTLEQAKNLFDKGATFVACHSHTTDFMKGHPKGTIHITCLVPKAHKKADMPLSQVDFDLAQLPKDKRTPIITYCASST